MRILRIPKLSFFVCLFSAAFLSAQSYAPLLERYDKTFRLEKVFVRTDKNIYAAGETIWAALYLVDGRTH